MAQIGFDRKSLDVMMGKGIDCNTSAHLLNPFMLDSTQHSF
jgi:hypothetical protein